MPSQPANRLMRFHRPEDVDVSGTAFAEPRNRLMAYFKGPQTGPDVRDPQSMGHDPFIFGGGGTATRESSLQWGEALASPAQRKIAEVLGGETGSKMMMLANFLGPGLKAPMGLPARALEQGYRRAYHGTATKDGKLFTEFDPARTGGQVSQSRSAQEGVSVSFSPDVANEYALLAAQRTGGDPVVMPLAYRSERPAALRLDGTEKNLEVAATLNNAFRDGDYDSVVMRNYSTPGGRTGENIAVVRDPNQLRSLSADFDPTKKKSANLLASRIAPWLFGAGLYGAGENQ